jgi:glycosyltransferase involved in cell wall biosynthesis
MRVLIVIPAFNEEKKLPRAIEVLHSYLDRHPGHDYEIVVASNGSTDCTVQVTASLAATYSRVRLYNLAAKGRGGALREVWGKSEADILTYMDADLSTDLAALPKMIESLASGDFDLVAGSRVHRESVTRRSIRRGLISFCYNGMVRLNFSTRVSDLQCGFKGITRETASALLPMVEDRGFFFDTEMLLIAESCGYRILDLPVRWIENTDSRVNILRTAWNDIKGLLRLRRSFRANKYSHLIRQRLLEITKP